MNNNPASRRVQILADPTAIARAAAEEFTRRAVAAVRERGRFTVALAGGSTPKALYGLLATEPAFRERVPWDQTFLFFGDERHVGPEDKDANYRMAREAMLDRLVPGSLPVENVRRVPAENPDPYAAAAEYAAGLENFFGGGGLPRFDLILLGMGDNAHCASLFPGTSALRESDRLVAAVWVDTLSTYRLTLTPPVLRGAAAVLFLVGGAGKAEAVRAVLEGAPEPDRYPSQGITAHDGETIWLLDQAAAGKLAKLPAA